ncbi:Bax inhibitor-1/YccA family protein [Rarobacter incanus]|uniref:Putative YccA/Bax inhibitor family protein n=1 Tax=Rarobacter incanus TaxID=153494 RepID=A0A542SNU7_9MICO|nr:Bax inhibitor-1/YccA family protein [Rarobacter incanus]TQK76283.1 putative YccA/Bax inhibitor family protein [Rarobacter incanus]
MSNPIFSNNKTFTAGTTVQRFPDQTVGAGSTIDANQLDTMYQAPAASPLDTNRLTIDDVIVKTAGVFGLLVVAAVIGWQIAETMPAVWLGALVIGMVLGLVNSFKRKPSPVLILAYAVAEGVFLGAISAAYNAAWDGIVLQAVLATFATFAACLFLFKSGRVRVTPKFNKFLLIAIAGYALFSLINLVLMWTGVLSGWGMFSGPLGIGIGLFAVGLASMSLISDFDSIQNAISSGAPRNVAWTAAFGLIVTLVWLYLEFLRLLAILRNN